MPSNSLHTLYRDAAAEAEQCEAVKATPQLLEEEDDSWEGWLPLHNAARWGCSRKAVAAAVKAFPDACAPVRGLDPSLALF